MCAAEPVGLGVRPVGLIVVQLLVTIGSLVRLEGVNRPVKIQLKPKSNSPAALPLCERGTAAPTGEISSQFKIYLIKFR